ncbi:MAG: hypothetical protein IJB97_09195 [Clostridia bacterium]|nr:hypothetical protein [Clostridia bacterium]
MKKFAVIDVGSNSVRLMFVADGKVLYKKLNTTRLGEGLAEAPYLKPEAIERSAVAVAEFYKTAKAEGAESVCVFATAATRSSKNGYEFTNRVKELCGLEVDVVSGEAEALLGISGALGAKNGGVIDIGGASTEIVLQQGGEIVYAKSIDIGVVRLKDLCDRDEEKLLKTAKLYVKNFGDIKTNLPIYAIGGTATTLGAVYLGEETYDPEKITGLALSKETVIGLAKKLLETSVEEVATLPGMLPKRADVIGGGATLLSVIMETFGFDKVIISDSDNLEGYAKKKGLL